jgi:glutamyl-tRNA synthetase
MHLGNARTALFSALLALKDHGSFLLRIEDTDEARSKESMVTALMADLRWLGLEWQEGPEVGGDNAPYWQSQRQAIYDKYYQELIDRKLAYPCFCSQEQLALSRKLQRSKGKAPRYAGTCRHLSVEEIANKRNQGIAETLRFYVTSKNTIQFIDLIKGRQRFQSDDIGDFIIRRADGTPAFFFCNAIDDSLMGVTHVIRGEDHLTNTPRQILILQALKLFIPEYGHIPLIVGLDNTKLSKRHGSRSIQELREEGYLSLAVLNYMSRLGHNYENSKWMTFDELGHYFSLDAVGKSPAKFDGVALDYWQKEGVLSLQNDAFWKWIKPALDDIVSIADQQKFIDTVKDNILFPVDAQRWAQIFYAADLQYNDTALDVFRKTGSEFFAKAHELVSQNQVTYQDLCEQLKTTLNVKGKNLFMPLRLVLTGEMHGPELAKIFDLLGHHRVAERFKKALLLLSSSF